MKRITHDEAKLYRSLSSSEIRHNMRRAIAYTLTPIPDNPKWDEITYYGASWIDPTNTPQHPHYIYILVNPSIPGICKIGFTTTTVYDRVKQINSATGVITPWQVRDFWFTQEPYLAEQEIHDLLSDYRVEDNREGFAVNFMVARDVIFEILGIPNKDLT